MMLFETAGAQNTEATLQIARERALALGIMQVVVASSHGKTARRAHALFAPLGVRIIAGSICEGWNSPEGDKMTMSAETKAELAEMGITVHTGVQALGGSLAEAVGGEGTVEGIVSATLRRFCQGMKVTVECVLMAAAAGLLDMKQEVIAIAGTGRGADTAIVCKPANPFNFKALEIREILAKPRLP